MPVVVSTLAADVDYVGYLATGNGVNTPVRKVRISGGSGVAKRLNMLAGEALTKTGIMTEVTEDELEFLESNETFKLHKKNGHIVVAARVKNPEAVAKNMSEADPSRPLNDADFKKGGRAEVKDMRALA